MMIHISLDGFITIHVESAWAYGRCPVWKIARFGREFILDIPFCRIIVTPAPRALRKSYAAYNFFNRVGWNRDDTEKPLGADGPHAGITEDRS